jgi:hypothetical protein
MQSVVRKLISVNQRGKPVIILLITFYVIYMDIVLSILTIYHRFASLILFLILFLFWVYRLTVYDLRREYLPGLSYRQKNIFIALTFISLFIMTLRFSDGEIDFSYVLYIILSFSFFMWVIFLFIDKIAFPGSEIRFYFGIIFLTALVNTGINYFLKLW